MTVMAIVALVWIYLYALHGDFWRSTPELSPALPSSTPAVDIIVPARNEAETIDAAIGSLLGQDYKGPFRVILVDDRSTDSTADIARRAAGEDSRLTIITGADKPPAWSGKLFALDQGVAGTTNPRIFLAEAEIVHDPRHVSTLVARLETPSHGQPLQMVSEMVRLNCESVAERALIPAFVYFFQMLYPFARVNNPLSTTAAAAGGTVLIRRTALEQIGGLKAMHNALIHDVTLARRIKRHGAIFLGHSGLARSIRRYPHARDIREMIARTAFTQLRYSPLLLGLALLGLAFVWLLPPSAILFSRWDTALFGWIAYVTAILTYQPTLRRYGLTWAWGLTLPAIALVYMEATITSAWRYWQGAGAAWKNRDYGSAA